MSNQKLEETIKKLRGLFYIKPCEDADYKRKPVDEKLKQEIIDEQKGKCFLCECKTTVPMLHHKKPDGESVKDNLVMLCYSCHTFIHSILKRFLGYRGTATFNRKW